MGANRSRVAINNQGTLHRPIHHWDTDIEFLRMGCASSTPELTNSDRLASTYKRARLLQNLVQQTNKIDPSTRYDIVKKIGVGSMGYVSTVKKIGDGQVTNLYAMKTLRPGRMTREFIAELKNEIRSVRRLDHPNIVRFHEVYYGKEISIIMDFCSGGDCYERMPYTEQQAASVTRQVLEALRYMHGRGYVHLDIKVGWKTFWSRVITVTSACFLHSARTSCSQVFIVILSK